MYPTLRHVASSYTMQAMQQSAIKEVGLLLFIRGMLSYSLQGLLAHRRSLHTHSSHHPRLSNYSTIPRLAKTVCNSLYIGCRLECFKLSYYLFVEISESYS